MKKVLFYCWTLRLLIDLQNISQLFSISWCTVLFEWNLTERFLQFIRNFSKYQNMQYTIGKPYKIVTKNEKKLKFSTFVSFLGQFLKKWCFVTLKPVKIFEWNFQQSFLIEIHEKWIHNGWACPPFCACHAHFSKTLIFQKWP